ncbi:hypothetical protein SRABI44_01143 [Microbacterium foliorum]|nr:hypothetical protein SRABI03_00258 [Microbacterium foliorum]CAH0168448.1 hypothetical protein SRABI44_01143 [Microbacterium foliorum]
MTCVTSFTLASSVYFRHNEQVTGSIFPHLRALIASAAAVVVAASLLVAAPAGAATAPLSGGVAAVAASQAPASSTAGVVDSSIRKTADLSKFRPGNIIADEVFFDSSTMTVSDINTFLDSKVKVCRSSYACLKSYSQHTPNKNADAYCNGYTAGYSEYASSIIYKVAQSCGINPQVLLTMLEKEQSLVTSSYPSEARFRTAMGQGCPDTAGCDPAYAGFFYQVYGAARQMKIYAEGRYFTYYAPGKTWNILYNPQASCGRGPVYIENVATSALYYYTPYQPNRAALAAGYGEGDACSAHGNRNFYQYFTDWFGSTQVPTIRLVKASNANEIYLVTGKRKYHITTSTDLQAYMAVLGWYHTSDPATVAALTNAGTATRFVRDARDGGMYLLEPDGSKHHFTAADQVTRLGFNMAVYTSLGASLIDSFRTGTAVGAYFKAEGDDRFFRWENGTKRHVVNPFAWAQQSAADRAYVATVPAANAAAIPTGVAILPAGMTVREYGSPDVYIAGTGAEIIHLPTWGLARDAGIRDAGVVPSGTLAKNAPVGAKFSAVVACGDVKYVVDGGGLTRVQTAPAGTTITALPASLCSSIPKTGRTVGEAVLVKTPGADAVYLLQGNQLRHLRSQQRLQEANGNRPLYFFSWSTDTRSGFAVGAPLLADRTFVTLGSPETYFVDKGVLRHVQSSASLLRLAAPQWPTVVDLPAAYRSSYQFGTPIP